MTNLEGCGGCVYGAAQGLDCTALPNVEDVDCQAGSCVISTFALFRARNHRRSAERPVVAESCVPGYAYQPMNRTCVYDLSA
jgi:hypothetical protein